ncbi:MAG: RNA polymerase sigma factor [Chloroflexi bacterium]|nr:MAG: RNA polymerase sigma factor [Chloroflexota bacterium]
MPTDKELVLELQRGSLEALGFIYDRHQKMVYRTALVITGDPESAADLVQDVFLRLYRFSDRIDPERPLEPWLYRITANLSYTWIKKNRRWLPSLEEVAEWLAGTVRVENNSSHEYNDDWHQINTAISALPAQQRMVIVLYYVNDLPLQEISEILDVPVGTVKSRLHYGREVLKRHLGVSPNERLSDLKYEFT